MSILYNRPQTARFIARPNRFIAHVLVGDEVVVCHVKNTGRCRELLLPGARVIIAPARNPLRKTAYDLIAVYKGEMLVNIDSQAPNALVHRCLSSRYPGTQVRPEARIGHSRLDFLVNLRPGWDSQAGPQPPESLLYVEVKGVTLEEGGIARFPDAPRPGGPGTCRNWPAWRSRATRPWCCLSSSSAPLVSFVPTMPWTRPLGSPFGRPQPWGCRWKPWTAWWRKAASAWAGGCRSGCRNAHLSALTGDQSAGLSQPAGRPEPPVGRCPWPGEHPHHPAGPCSRVDGVARKRRENAS